MKYDVLDLFSGAGSYSLGFAQAGYNIVAGIDIDAKCGKTFTKNHDTEFICGDLREMDPSEWKGSVDGIIGSPPCIHHSTAKRDGDPKKGMVLINEFYKWVKVIQPKFWIMENVSNILKRRSPEGIKDDPRFPVKKVLNAANFGVPQLRKRVFAGKFNIPKPTHIKGGNCTLFGGKMPKWVTAFEGIETSMNSDLPNAEMRNNFDIEKMLDKINRGFGMQKRRVLKPGEPAPTVTDMHGDAFIIIDRFPKHQSWAPSYNGNKRPSRVITRVPHTVISPVVYVLSVRDHARLQSFPDDFVLYGNINQCYKMVGNAVSTLLAKRIAEANIGKW